MRCPDSSAINAGRSLASESHRVSPNNPRSIYRLFITYILKSPMYRFPFLSLQHLCAVKRRDNTIRQSGRYPAIDKRNTASFSMVTTAETELLDNEAVQDRSYGLIPIRVIPSASSTMELASTISTANTQVLLIKTRPSQHSQKAPYWSFPKGHSESWDLSNLHTAIREVQEETGLLIPETRILFKDADGLKERYRRGCNGYVKEVQYWIGHAEWLGDAEIRIQEEEVLAARWLDWQEALELIAGDRIKPLKTAIALLNRSSE